MGSYYEGKLREQRLSHAEKWMDEQNRQLSIDDELPKTLITTDNSTAYAILVASIAPWNISNSIKRKLEEIQLSGERQIACSLSMSFYHAQSKKFYGSTFVGHEHTFTLKNLNSIDLSINNLNELVYFQTRVNDPSCFVIIELVTSLFDAFSESIEKRFGSGFAIVSPFFNDGTCHVKAPNELIKSGPCAVYDGSPRDLLNLKGNGSNIFQQLSKQETKSVLTQKIWRCYEIGETIKSSNIITENQIVGACTNIVGLDLATVNYFDERDSSTHSCIGAQTSGNILDWVMSPSDSIKIASSLSLSLADLQLTIPNRSEFEQRLCKWVVNAIPKEKDKANRLSSIFNWNCSSPNKPKPNNLTIASRRMKIGTHNGHKILKWHELELHEDGAADVLKSSQPMEVNAFEDPSFAIVFVTEYIFEDSKSATKQTPHQIAITVGSTVLLPYDKDCGAMTINETTIISLNLITDERSSMFTMNAFYSPSNSPGCVLTFGLKPQSKSDAPKQTVLDCPSATIERPHTVSGSISLDGTVKSQFIRRKKSHRSESKDDCSFNSFPDASTLTFEESLIEMKEECSDDAVIAIESRPGKVVAAKPRSDHKPSSYSVLAEVDDPYNTTNVCIILSLFSAGSGPSEMPKSLSFQLKLWDNDEIVTDFFQLKAGRFNEQAKVSFQFYYPSPEAARSLAQYMLERDMFVEVFDDNRFHLGTLALPMHLFLRQGKTEKRLDNLSADVITPRGIGYDGQVLRVEEGAVQSGKTAGSICLSIELKGSKQAEQNDASTPHSAPTKRYALNMLDTNTNLRMLASKCEGASSSTSAMPIKTKSESSSENAKSLKQRQLDTVEGFHRQHHKRDDEVDSVLPILSGVGPKGPFQQDYLLLKAAKLIREKQKRHLIAAHIQNASLGANITLRPFVGQSLLFEIEVENPFATEESFAIKSSHPGVRVAASVAEWDARRKVLGARLLPGKEGMIRFEFLQDGHVTMEAHRKLVVPLVLDQRTTRAEKITISLVSTKNDNIAASFLLDVRPWVRCDRRFIIPCHCNGSIRRSFEFRPNDVSTTNLAIKVIDETSNGVKCEWTHREAGGESLYELSVDYRCTDAASNDFVHVVISKDNSNTILECWTMSFEARISLYETACLGAKVRKEIVVSGGKTDRLVKCCVMILPNHVENSSSNCRFDNDMLQLMANKINRLNVSFQFLAAGRWNVLLNFVDRETGLLVHSSILAVQVHLPMISKDYSIEVFPGQAKQIKLPFTNCLDQTRIINVSSSNELILFPQTPKIQLTKGETVYARFRVKVEKDLLSSIESREQIDVFLFTRDESTNSQDCVRIRLHIQNI